MSKVEVAYDRLGQEIRVGSIIVAPYTRSKTVIAEVTSISPKKLRFKDILRNTGMSTEARPTYNKYHHEVVCIDGLKEHVTMAKLQENL